MRSPFARSAISLIPILVGHYDIVVKAFQILRHSRWYCYGLSLGTDEVLNYPCRFDQWSASYH